MNTVADEMMVMGATYYGAFKVLRKEHCEWTTRKISGAGHPPEVEPDENSPTRRKRSGRLS